MFFKRFSLFLAIFAGCLSYENAKAQLWKYVGDTPEKEKAFDIALKKEAYQVIQHHTPDDDKFPYDEIVYRLWSLDSSLTDIHITQVPFTKVLSIKCATDSLEIAGCVGPGRLHFLRKDLFEIVYSPLGGSDDGYENVLLLALNKGKFRIALEIESSHDFDDPGFFELDEAHLKLAGVERKDYHLTVKAHQLHRADNKVKNFDHYETYSLRYDDKLNVFYSSYKPVSGYVYDESENKSHLKGIYPVIDLGDASYCYVKDRWYSIGRDYQSKKVILLNYCHRPDVKGRSQVK